MLLKELNHTAIRTGDMKKALCFYVDILGGRIIRDAHAISKKGHYIYIQLANGVIELVEGVPGEMSRGFQHIAFLISDDRDIQGVRKYLGEAGYVYTAEPRKASSGDGFVSFLKDVSGVSFEMIQRQENIRIAHLQNPYIEEFDHISVSVSEKDYPKCESSYTGILGFQLRRTLQWDGGMLSYFGLGNDTIETYVRYGKPALEKPLDHIAFRVKNYFEIKRYLESKGVVCSAPERSAVGSYYVMDVTGPDGEHIQFLDRDSLDRFQG